MRKTIIVLAAAAALSCCCTAAFAQRYEGGLRDKTVAIVGNEMVSLADIEALCGTRVEPRRTLLFFDEIQLCPDAIRSLKYWQEDAPELVVVSAGSLIGLALLEGTGWPVGKTRSMTLRPLSFREFLCAVGDEPLSDLVAEGDARGL